MVSRPNDVNQKGEIAAQVFVFKFMCLELIFYRDGDFNGGGGGGFLEQASDLKIEV